MHLLFYVLGFRCVPPFRPQQLYTSEMSPTVGSIRPFFQKRENAAGTLPSTRAARLDRRAVAEAVPTPTTR